MNGAVVLMALARSATAGTPESGPCDRPVAELVAAIREAGTRETYDCLIARDDAGPALVVAVAAPPDPTTSEAEGRVTRALAVHLARRLDRPLRDDEVRALGASDRRLLRDAVHARRGRKSPSRDHDRVFSQFDWYRPDPGYTDVRLTPTDRANIDLLDHPPPPPPPPSEEPAASAMPPKAPAEAPEGATCGCGALPRGGLAAVLVPLLLPLTLRRLRARPAASPAGAAPSAGTGMARRPPRA